MLLSPGTEAWEPAEQLNEESIHGTAAAALPGSLSPLSRSADDFVPPPSSAEFFLTQKLPFLTKTLVEAMQEPLDQVYPPALEGGVLP